MNLAPRTSLLVLASLCALPACSSEGGPAAATSGGSAGSGPGGGGGGAGSSTVAAGSSTGGAGTAGSQTVAGGGSAGSPGGTGGSGGLAGSGGTVMDPGTEGDGDFEIGPDYPKDPDLTDKGAPKGKDFQFSMSSADSQTYKGDDTTLNEPKAFTRQINVYVPAKYVDGTEAPLLVVHDGPGPLGLIKNALDNLTIEAEAARKLPAFIVITVANGGGDSYGSQRGLEYDTMSGRLASFIDGEVLPAVLANGAIKAAYPNLKLTKDPQGKATMGCSSGGAAALTMGWFRPDLFGRLITYSGTFVDQQDSDAAEEVEFPYGAWEYHSSKELIKNTPIKPLRIFTHVSENDLRANDPENTQHNWVMANQRTAAALKAKNYHYRFLFAKDAGHCDGKIYDLTLAETLLWTWRGYPTVAK